jgi:hypothetical protein
VRERAPARAGPSGEHPPSGRARLLAGLALAVVCLGLVVGYGLQFNGTTAYPNATAIDANYDQRVGDRVHLWTTVVDERDGWVVLGADRLRLRATAPPPSAVTPGDQVQVLGRLAPDRRFETTAAHVQSSGRVTYMYGVSLVGGVVAAAAFLRRWRVDPTGWRFVPRESRVDDRDTGAGEDTGGGDGTATGDRVPAGDHGDTGRTP